MVSGLIGKKLGMTQVFDDSGRVIPVTVIKTGPCVIVQKKTKAKEGYEAVQLGFVDEDRKTRVNQPMEGHFKKADVPPTSFLREFSYTEEEEEELKVGDNLLIKDVFQENERVDVAGRTIGRGFQGVMRRHGYHGGRASHGSMFHRAPGSIGASASPSRVYPGTKLPGRMGGVRVKTPGLRIVKIDEEKNLLLVKGAVPGSKGNYVTITRAI